MSGPPTLHDGRTVEDLPDHEFRIAAAYTATSLHRYGHSFTRLSPRDSTSYEISIVRPLRQWDWDRWQWLRDNKPEALIPPRFAADDYFVANNFGPMYRWTGQPFGEWTYVYEKMTDTNRISAPWTACVLWRFLNTLAEEIELANERFGPQPCDELPTRGDD